MNGSGGGYGGRVLLPFVQLTIHWGKSHRHTPDGGSKCSTVESKELGAKSKMVDG